MSSDDGVIHTTAPTSSERGADARPAKRHRITIACSWCRQRKSRCDGVRPTCSTCSAHGYSCVYSTNTVSLNKTAASKELFETLEDRLTALETSMTRLDNRVTDMEGCRTEDTDSNRYCRQLHHQSLSVSADSSLETVIGTAINAKDPTDGIGSMTFTKEEGSGFFGPSSNIALTRQVVQTTTAVLRAKASAANPETTNDATLQGYMFNVTRPSSPTVSSSYLRSPVRQKVNPFALPAEAEVLRLIQKFFTTTGLLFPYLDEGTFVKTYQQSVSSNVCTPRRSWLALLNVVLAMATHTGWDRRTNASNIGDHSDLFFQRALLLCEVDMRCATSLEIVQSLLLISQYLQGTERSIETWNIHGLAVKAAYHLGLHSPNALIQYPQPEREFRKRTWFGCVLLDRSLSMTLGRPPSIPQNFVKLDLPCSPSLLSSRNPIFSQDLISDESTQFYTVTITLYNIMGEVIDVLYGSNIGCDVTDNVFDLASHLIGFERKFLDWQRALPKALSLVQVSELCSPTVCQTRLRLRFILTIRYLNLQILTHRPVLCKYLAILATAEPDCEQLNMLRQIGANSIRICAEAAHDIIVMMHQVLASPDPPRHLLGAWWFSLYYTFNAALIIYATLLVQNQASLRNQEHMIEESKLNSHHLDSAVDCLSLLSEGNRMSEKCLRYTASLAKTLSVIRNPEFHQNAANLLELPNDPLMYGHVSRPFHDDLSDVVSALQDSGSMNMGITLDDLLGADCGFVTSFKAPEAVGATTSGQLD